MSSTRKLVLAANSSWYIFNFHKPLLSSLLERGYSITIVTPIDEYSEKLHNLGCNIVAVKIKNKSINPFVEIITIINLLIIYVKVKPAVVLHFTPKLNIYGAISASLLSIPCINNITGLGTAFMKKGFLNSFVKILYRYSQRSAERVFFQNQDDRDLFIRSKIINAERTDLLPGSGIDLVEFNPVDKEESETVVFLMIARLIWDKGVKEFAEAAAIVKRKFPFTRFHLVGYIDHNNPRAVPEEMIRKWESEGVLRWFGRQNDVRPYISQADCIVLPSYREGTPRTLLEAASMAKPLIAANTIGCRDPVNDGINGLLCSPKDSDSLAEQMMKMIKIGYGGRIRMGQNGRKKMESEYNVEININKYLMLITNVLTKSRCN